MTGFESFVGVNPWTALFTFCNMLITFAVLKKIPKATPASHAAIRLFASKRSGL